MLTLKIAEDEFFDEETDTFVTIPETTIELEHSLLSVSKWESKFNRPFMSNEKKSREEILSYIHMMVLNENVPENIVKALSNEDISRVSDYIDSPQSATTFNNLNENQRPSREIITSEIIYYWMISFKIPFECQTWHLNRLLTLIRVCSVKNSKQKKMPRHSVAKRNRELNRQRRARLKTSG